MDDQKTKTIVEIARRLWPAYETYLSNGSTSSVFDRHIWPVIRDIRSALRDLDDLGPIGLLYAIGFRNPDDPDSYGMFFGPCPTIEECEEHQPYFEHGQPHRRCFIFFFDGEGGQHIVAEWRNDRWEGSDGT